MFRKIQLLATFACLLSICVNAQDKKLPPLDASPMDMAYYPVMYPYTVKVKGEPGTLVARVIYSRPQTKGRDIFGNLEEYGQIWRLGANEATEIEFFRPVIIAGKNIPKGRYTMYAIPTEKTWTIILNKDTDIWGAFKYDQKKDVVRTALPVMALDTPVEAFTMVFEKGDPGANLVIAWDKVSVSLPIKWSEGATAKKK
ncbi:Protein of unknown function [Chitinophaga terrae (ex Kim and Jung 2007)]|jgi:hypothetical protein|uniref:DUF2911 domain-containing protein n=1 Tax=Chitinophaga terrae (ex Kim and Jung 2007) TaxID=408074 RepID=A0A1H4FBE4_9BACT|nr:DUF2911 domain-containing protein [Chitinophaga terrae (ex Kim and Jung 2007)]MDQ0105049.1 hypothetical protein [Chitinophaga terrae (ex Kim and Jung 2007)]GEP92272.1 hypothetical protein CTE07_39170 [Chitinophaga terrae (ex Kim and Jung 2007)]SEA94200.1 Protein of unknown function [Chitinophaga terrae (ex Kim and Jung 2007)]